MENAKIRPVPILVTGSHRSGSTWVGNTLMLDPHITYIQEPFNVDFPNPNLGYRPRLWFYSAEGAPDEQEIYQAFRAMLEKTTQPFSNALMKHRTAPWAASKPLKFIKNLLKTFVYAQRPLIKDPIALLSAGWLCDRLGCQVVCMIRHPLAFVGSLKKWNWQFDFSNLTSQKQLRHSWLSQFGAELAECRQGTADTLSQACLLWNILHYRILLYREAYPSWLYLRYEDLAARPVEKFGEVFDSLGLCMTARAGKHIKRLTSGKNPPETQSPSFKARDSRQSIHTWQQRLTSEEAGIVIKKTGNIAEKLYPSNPFTASSV